LNEGSVPYSGQRKEDRNLRVPLVSTGVFVVDLHELSSKSELGSGIRVKEYSSRSIESIPIVPVSCTDDDLSIYPEISFNNLEAVRRTSEEAGMAHISFMVAFAVTE
jgi:hypothetical protein